MIFLSHSWSDKQIARRVLESACKRGFPTWIDEQQIGPGDFVMPECMAAIEASSVFLYFASEAAFLSNNVQRELTHALDYC